MVPFDSGSHGPQPANPTSSRWRSYTFVFDSPQWLVNFAWGSLCFFTYFFIPFAGSIVMTGYQFDVFESLHHRPQGPYPDFKFEKLGDYLGRGFWPMVIATLFGAIALIALFALAMLAGAILLFQFVLAEPVHPAPADPSLATASLWALVLILIVLLIYVALMALLMVTVPMMLRSGLMHSLGEGFNMAFVRGFIRLVWWEMILDYGFTLTTSLLLVVGAIALGCVGVFPAMFWITVSQIYLVHQLYELYLSRGGEPVPFKK